MSSKSEGKKSSPWYYYHVACRPVKICMLSKHIEQFNHLARILQYTVVNPNKETLKIYETGSNNEFFPLFIQFPYLKNFDEILPESSKPPTEIGFIDQSCQIWTISDSFRGLVLNLWSKSFKFYSKWAKNWLILLKNWPIFTRFLTI